MKMGCFVLLEITFRFILENDSYTNYTQIKSYPQIASSVNHSPSMFTLCSQSVAFCTTPNIK